MDKIMHIIQIGFLKNKGASDGRVPLYEYIYVCFLQAHVLQEGDEYTCCDCGTNHT